MTITIRAISSMAMSAALGELGQAFEKHFGMKLDVESLGGVDAARRVAEGERSISYFSSQMRSTS